MRDSAASFFDEDPTQRRVATRVDRSMKRGPGAPMVGIEVRNTASRPPCHAFALDLVDAAASEPVLLKPSEDRRRYAFALSPASLQAFRDAECDVRIGVERESTSKLDVTVSEVVDPVDWYVPLPRRIELGLDCKDGYILINETVVSAGKTVIKTNSEAPKTDPAAASPCHPSGA